MLRSDLNSQKRVHAVCASQYTRVRNPLCHIRIMFQYILSLLLNCAFPVNEYVIFDS